MKHIVYNLFSTAAAVPGLEQNMNFRQRLGIFLGILVYVFNVLFNKARYSDKNQQLSIVSAIASIFFKYWKMTLQLFYI